MGRLFELCKGDYMGKIVVLLMAVLLFVGCENKENDKGSMKAAAPVTTKIGTMELTVDKPSNVTIQKGMVAGYDIVSPSYRLIVMEGGEFSAKNLKDALEAAKSINWKNVKGEELKNGYLLTYDMEAFGKSYNVMARIDKGDKSFDISGTSINEKDVAAMIAIVKSMK